MELENTIVANRFKIRSKLGSGSFGVVYLAQSLSSKEKVAIKVESTSSNSPQLISESRILRMLGEGTGFPKMYWSGTEDNRNILVMELLGSSLADLQERYEKLTPKTVLTLAVQMIERIEFMHERDIIHRDIKPDNFLMGPGSRSRTLYMVDFGLSKRFRDPKLKMHIRYREGKSLVGTARYVSVNTHIGIEQSRRDDLESIGYVLIYLLNGKLPWQSICSMTKQEKYHRIMELKMNTSIDILCKKLPNEFAVYINYCKSLQFEASPDYQYLKKLFYSAAEHLELKLDFVFEWNERRSKQFKKKSLSKFKKRRSEKQRSEKVNTEAVILDTLENDRLPEFKDRDAVMRLYHNANIRNYSHSGNCCTF